MLQCNTIDNENENEDDWEIWLADTGAIMSSDQILLTFPAEEETLSPTKTAWYIRRKRQRTTPSPTPTPTADGSSIHVFTFPTYSYSYQLNNGFQIPTVVDYSTFLVLSLVLWVLYLILPSGLRKYMCNGQRRRYKRSRTNRDVRVLGDGLPSAREALRISKSGSSNGGASKGLFFSQSKSSEFSNESSSVNSTLQRGNQKFAAMKKASPTKRPLFGEPIEMNRRENSGIIASRRQIEPISSSEVSTITSGADYSSKMSSGSSDLSSVTLNENHETMSSTGHAIWGTPKRFSRRRIIDTSSDENSSSQRSAHIRRGGAFNYFGGDRSEERKPSHLIQNFPVSDVESFASSFYSSVYTGKSGVLSSGSKNNDTETTIEASSSHPDTKCGHTPPSQMVLSSTLLSFRDPGIRLYAHGTQCEPRRIWIRLDVNNERLSWRTENAESNAKNKDIVTLGQVHEIPLMKVLFIDVGKSTAALQVLNVHEDFCFSILTNGGSLDLQASNKLERDALISCMCLILDTVYNHLPPDRSWRKMNDAARSESNSGSSFTSNEGSQNDQNKTASGQLGTPSPESTGTNNLISFSSSSSQTTDSIFGSDVFHGVDLGSQVSANFGEI